MPLDAKRVAIKAFRTEADQIDLELSPDERDVLIGTFDFNAVQEGIDSERERLRVLMEDSPAMRKWLRISELDIEDRRRLQFLAKLYARLIRDMKRSGHSIDEEAAQRAKDFLKTTGRACDVYPC